MPILLWLVVALSRAAESPVLHPRLWESILMISPAVRFVQIWVSFYSEQLWAKLGTCRAAVILTDHEPCNHWKYVKTLICHHFLFTKVVVWIIQLNPQSLPPDVWKCVEAGKKPSLPLFCISWRKTSAISVIVVRGDASPGWMFWNFSSHSSSLFCFGVPQFLKRIFKKTAGKTLTEPKITSNGQQHLTKQQKYAS